MNGEEPLKNKESQAIENAKAELSRQIAFYKFQQYEFDRQWKRLRSYANENGIEIIGDIPIYVAFVQRGYMVGAGDVPF